MAFQKRETIREIQAEARRLTLKRLREAREESGLPAEPTVEYNSTQLVTAKEAKEDAQKLTVKKETIEQTIEAVRGEPLPAVYDETTKDSPSKGQAASKSNSKQSDSSDKKGGK